MTLEILSFTQRYFILLVAIMKGVVFKIVSFICKEIENYRRV